MLFHHSCDRGGSWTLGCYEASLHGTTDHDNRCQQAVWERWWVAFSTNPKNRQFGHTKKVVIVKYGIFFPTKMALYFKILNYYSTVIVLSIFFMLIVFFWEGFHFSFFNVVTIFENILHQ